jgi:hypothetical protein
MSALPDTVVPFVLPKKPKVKQKESPPDQRRLSVLPIRAGKDQRLHGGTLRTLIVLCSYCNRAGLTWVSQAKLAQDLGVTRQAIGKQLALLVKLEYVQIVKKGFRGVYSNTLRVIYDDSVDTDTAIAITSAQEDNRPPTMPIEDDRPDPAGQRKIASLLAQAFKSPPTRSKTMPKSGETRTVREMKEAIQKAQSKHSHKQPPEVANEEVKNKLSIGNLEAQIRQPPEVAPTGKERIKRVSKEDLFKRSLDCLGNLEVDELIADGLTAEQIADSLDTLLPLYRAEGIEPTSAILADGIRQLQADAR